MKLNPISFFAFVGRNLINTINGIDGIDKNHLKDLFYNSLAPYFLPQAKKDLTLNRNSAKFRHFLE